MSVKKIIPIFARHLLAATRQQLGEDLSLYLHRHSLAQNSSLVCTVPEPFSEALKQPTTVAFLIDMAIYHKCKKKSILSKVFQFIPSSPAAQAMLGDHYIINYVY